MASDPAQNVTFPSALAAAQYLRAEIGGLVKVAAAADLESTEAMLLAARIEAGRAIRNLSLRADEITSPQSGPSNAADTMPPGEDAA